MVLENSLPLFNAFFESHEDDAPPEGWTMKDSYHFKESQLQWFYDRGCKWKKVEAGPGDVILWDSRCVHYGAAAKGDRPRVATCELACWLGAIPWGVEIQYNTLHLPRWSYCPLVVFPFPVLSLFAHIFPK